MRPSRNRLRRRPHIRHVVFEQVEMPAGGSVAAMQVEVKDWSVFEHATGLEIPAQGFYVAQVLSGVVVTEIDGKSETRKPRNIELPVSAGAPMTVTLAPRNEQAQLRTIAINPGP